MGRTTLTGEQVRDDSLTGDDIDESTLILNTIKDADGDTKIQVEESADEDKIRFDIAGSEKMVLDGTGFGVGTSSPASPLHVYGNLNGTYVATIDNDQNSNGHVLKLLTDGNGSGSRLLEMDDGDGEIIFRARADGRFGFGADGVDSMGAGTFVVGIDNSSHTSDIAISRRMQHLGDGDTYIDFPANDQMLITVGNMEMVRMVENGGSSEVTFNDGASADLDLVIKGDSNNPLFKCDATNNRVGIAGVGSPAYELDVGGNIGLNEYIYHNGDADTFIRFEADNITLKAGNVNFIELTEDDSQDKLICNNGSADLDFIVRSPNENLALYLNAGNEVFHINHGESNFKTKIHSDHGEAITVNDTGVIINDDGHATNDFRIESDTNDHMFFVDGGNNRAGINTSTPGSGFAVNSSFSLKVVGPKSSDYSIAEDDSCVTGDCNSGNVTLTLPVATDAMIGRIYTIKRLDTGNSGGSNTLTVGRNGKNIDGEASDFTMGNKDALVFQCIGAIPGWILIGSYMPPPP